MTDQRTALVTGSTSGIGLGIATALAAAGYEVILNGIGSPEEINSSITALEAINGKRSTFIGTDLTDPKAIQIALSELIESYKRIDILVNNAGIQFTCPILEYPVACWDQVIALNLSACFHTTRLVLPKMLDNDFGRIINVASVHGLVASINKVAYVTAKHGLVGLTKATALETAETNITCNAICPGWTDTPLIREQIKQRAHELDTKLEDAGKELLKEKQPSKKFVRTDDLGALVCFLCTESAAQITGASLPIDGGWTAQ